MNLNFEHIVKLRVIKEENKNENDPASRAYIIHL